MNIELHSKRSKSVHEGIWRNGQRHSPGGQKTVNFLAIFVKRLIRSLGKLVWTQKTDCNLFPLGAWCSGQIRPNGRVWNSCSSESKKGFFKSFIWVRTSLPRGLIGLLTNTFFYSLGVAFGFSQNPFMVLFLISWNPILYTLLCRKI